MNYLICLISFVLLAPDFSGQNLSYEIIRPDTLNKTDGQSKKQGKWIIFGRNKPGTCYAPSQKVEEGNYVDNKKTGIWTEYFCNGNPKNKLNFVNGRPNGYAVMYHENGKVSEEGKWRVNHWVGTYRLYDDSGKLIQEFKYDSLGKREGVREGTPTIHPDNGKVAMRGNWGCVKESGLIREYTGSVNNSSKKIIKDSVCVPFTLYNKNKQIIKEGCFINNKLLNGKAYFYNEDGILTRIAIYKNGIYTGDAPVEK